METPEAEFNPRKPLRLLRWLTRGLLGVATLFLLFLAGVWLHWGAFGINTVLHHGATFLAHGGSWWVDVAEDDARISPSMRLALTEAPPAVPGELHWRTIAPGFESGELPVLAEGVVVDRILLARIDPERYRFEVRSAPAGNRDLDGWMQGLNAVLVVNGSYYSTRGTPATPVLSGGAALGPGWYQAHAGAFVADRRSAGIRALGDTDWREAFSGASDAMVSYPLLVSAGPLPRHSQWLANRSFVGRDHQGRILVGTTADAFFSLDRLAAFLRSAPLDLELALNLDGGPVACQGIALNGYSRKIYGQWELQVHDGQPRLLDWPYGPAPMPLVLAVFPKERAGL
jgi:hypothetical protein